MAAKEHWETVYKKKGYTEVSWYQPHASQSMKLIESTQVLKSASIIDVGGGASPLVDDLIDAGFSKVTVLDLSKTALEASKFRLGNRSKSVNWIVSDILEVEIPKHSIDVWHDRAVFHFLTNESDRRTYVDAVLNAVKPGGFVIVATFAEDGPERCSGLNVRRYTHNSLHSEFGSPFELLEHVKEVHKTPTGSEQKFIYCFCRTKGDR